MRDYTNFKVTEGSYCEVQAEFDSLEKALDYISARYDEEDTIDQLVQIYASNEGENEIFGYLKVYDMLTKGETL